MNLRYSIDPADTDGGVTAAAIEREMDGFTTAATHDWHVGTDGQELLIVRDEVDTVGVYLGPEGIDIARESTVVLTSRLLEMIDTVQPGAGRAHLAAQEPTDAEVLAAAWAICRLQDDGYEPTEDHPCGACTESARAALSAARAVGRDAR